MAPPRRHFDCAAVLSRRLVDDDLEVAAAAAHDARDLGARDLLELGQVLGEQSLRGLERGALRRRAVGIHSVLGPPLAGDHREGDAGLSDLGHL